MVDDGEGEDLGAGLEMAGDHSIGSRQGDVRMEFAFDHVAVHAYQVGGAGWIFFKGVVRGKGPVADLVQLDNCAPIQSPKE